MLSSQKKRIYGYTMTSQSRTRIKCTKSKRFSFSRLNNLQISIFKPLQIIFISLAMPIFTDLYIFSYNFVISQVLIFVRQIFLKTVHIIFLLTQHTSVSPDMLCHLWWWGILISGLLSGESSPQKILINYKFIFIYLLLVICCSWIDSTFKNY